MLVPHQVEDPHGLLARRPVDIYGSQATNLIAGRRMLVTGAGGSIGSELVRQLHALNPAALFLLDHDESSMHAVQLELYGQGQLDHERTVLADIRDPVRMEGIFRGLQPDIVFHAAAHKHLSILERYPSEAIKTNVLGTRATVEAAQASGVERFILISTDKAADPTSVLGASKRLAEVVTQRAWTPSLRTASVRFGNVLGSRGSFLHTVDHQLRHQKPITVTDPDVERYFMTIPEAAGLVIEAAVMASRGETYVLDMGDPVKILDLVERFAAARGQAMPEVRYTGLLPGEKLTERLFDESENRMETSHEKIWKVPPQPDLYGDLEGLMAPTMRGDEEGVVDELDALGFEVSGRSARQLQLGDRRRSA